MEKELGTVLGITLIAPLCVPASNIQYSVLRCPGSRISVLQYPILVPLRVSKEQHFPVRSPSHHPPY